MTTKTRDLESNHIRSDKDPLEVRNILLSKIEALQDDAIAKYRTIQQKSTYSNVKEIVEGLIAAAEKEKQIVKELKEADVADSARGHDVSSSKLEGSLFEHLLESDNARPKENDIGAVIMYALNISTKLNTIYYILLNEYNHSAIKGSFRTLQEIENSKIRKLDKLYENLIVKGAY
ncbi:MAG: hypothetical protein ACP5MZ_03580 [Candidatus Micrarchaeia archaeon]